MNNFPNLTLAILLSSLAISCLPGPAWADKGSGHGSGGGSGSSGSSGGSGSPGGSGSSGSSGSSGHSNASGDDHSGSSHASGNGSDDHGSDGSSHHGQQRQEHVFEGGWRERLNVGQYEVFDPDGRLVIRRAPTPRDLKRFN